MYKVKTKTYLNRCIPDLNTLDAATEAALTASGAGVTISQAEMIYNTASEKGTNWFNTFLADFLLLRGYIFGFGIGVTVLIAFGYLFFLRIPGLLFIVLWSMICGIFALLATGSWLLWGLANTWSADGLHNNTEIRTMRTFAYFGMAVTILYFCLIVVLRKRVMLAIGIIIQAARALSAMPSILTLPLVQAIGLVAFLIPWVIYVLYLASSGQMMTLTGTYTYAGVEYTYKYRSFEYTQNTKYVFLYMLFTWFWTSEFILAIGQLIIALCFAAWYFSRDKSKIGFGTVSWAFRAALFYHTGTAAFGSLIIAIIKTIRAVIAYIQKKAKKSKNKVLEYAMCILQCVMWCFEKIMKFINKHAYIITAIYGTPFCSSTRKAFWLLLRNILRVAAVNMVATFVMFLGKIFVPLATTFVCYLAIAYGVDSDEISGLIAPLVFCFLLSCWVTSMFIEIFGMGIESILFCYIADEEMFKPEDRFAEDELADTIKKTAEKALALKKKKKKADDDAKAEASEGDGYAPVEQSDVSLFLLSYLVCVNHFHS
jgi:choline transporter-like protein 2/4/5